MDLNGFDASQVPEQQEFSALPAGQYVVIATASEEKATKSGSGSYLQITFEVLDGPFKARKLWARLNLNNQNKTAVEIAQRELGAICRAVGVIKPTRSEELHNKPLMVDVDVEIDDRNRQNNIIKKYAAVAAQPPMLSPTFTPSVAIAAQGHVQAPAAVAAPATPPWAKK